MIRKAVTIKNQMDLNARPIAHLVQEASQYNSQIYIELQEKRVNAKSIMGMMSLRLIPGENLTVVAEGDDEKEAVSGMEAFLTKK
ncbi:catabolite repression HPr-like protein [Aequitasia blattaphilus]|uniref:HPr family phosphocarrier protein n=1 Tax=Aequitasia blattaphilus TaxID=2949332 RepID=A0ABT1ECR1_9FIRM|nr:HPr family phosphocarrier protein [Aequitasia blattaphilus]MCP1103639.1 HPr family phosphocarrier protein [Aequitasia blattaphilus]MCR8616279.1 HPr family phosphocarrier protein [Aequitasia blattaphilus]